MIKRIIKIKGVGKYLNYSPKIVTAFNGELKSLTLIYGENGSGKTTITSIIQSLKNNNDLINRRKSFTHTSSPEIQFILDGISKPLTFENHKWESHYANIEVFDENFINENVYTGSEISSEHKKKLFDVVLGSDGIELKKKIEEIKTNIQSENSNLKNIEKEIQSLTSSTVDGNTFCFLPEDNEVQKKISDKQNEIFTTKQSELIQRNSELAEISYAKLEIDTNELKVLLEKTIENISDKFLTLFEAHKTKFPIDSETEAWIKKGFENIKDYKCPFCEQNLDGTNIIKAYSQYFSEEYVKLQSDTKTLSEIFNKINLPFLLSEIELIISNNTPLVDFWKNHISLDFYDEVVLQEKEKLSSLFEEIKKLIVNKINFPLNKVDTAIINEFEELLLKETQRYDEYNLIIKNFNQKISELKSSQRKDLSQLEEELRNLEIVSKRYSLQGISKANTYLATEGLIKRLNHQKDTKQSQLKNYTGHTFKNYKSRINQLLKKFASYLEIKEIKSAYHGSSKTPQVEYVLSVSGSEIKLNDDKITPSFKYVLSGGDKSALALSFFLAVLIDDTNLKNKIIVFDDPISSFDLQRKSATIKSLEWISKHAKQLIILTHNLSFAGSFYEECSTKNNLLSLQILNDNNTSHLCDFNIEEETLSGLLKDYCCASSYLKSNAKNDIQRRSIARCLRPMLEGYFRLKFYGEFNSTDWLGTFIKRIRESVSGDKLNKLINDIEEIEAINDYSKKYHHSFHPTTAEAESIYDFELRNYVERTFQLIEKV
ncbi:MAG: AAA family ATPase [Ginsengibacter sp.]